MDDEKIQMLPFQLPELLTFMLLFRILTHRDDGLAKVAELLDADEMTVKKLKIRVHDYLETHTNKELDFEPLDFNKGEL
jgi:hypothetical protein